MATRTMSSNTRPRTSIIRSSDTREKSSKLKNQSPEKKSRQNDHEIPNVPIKKNGINGRRVTRQLADTVEKKLTNEKNPILDLSSSRDVESDTSLGFNNNSLKVSPQTHTGSSYQSISKNEISTGHTDSRDDMASDNEEDSFIKLITNRSPAKLVSRSENPTEFYRQSDEISEALNSAALAEKNTALKKSCEPQHEMVSSSTRLIGTAKISPTRPIKSHASKTPQNYPKISGTKNLPNFPRDINKNYSKKIVQKPFSTKNKLSVQPNTRITDQSAERGVNSPSKGLMTQNASPQTRRLTLPSKSRRGVQSEPKPPVGHKRPQPRSKDQKKNELHQKSIVRRAPGSSPNDPTNPPRESFRTCPGYLGHSNVPPTSSVRTKNSLCAQHIDPANVVSLGATDIESNVSNKSPKSMIPMCQANINSDSAVTDKENARRGVNDPPTPRLHLKSRQELVNAEEAAKAARAEAAERGRRAVKEWAEKQAAMQKPIKA